MGRVRYARVGTGVGDRPEAEQLSDGEPIGSTGRYALVREQPLPHFDTRGGSAFVAIDNEDPSAPLYALVMPVGQPHRERVMTQLVQRPCTGLINPVASGVLGGGGQKRLAVVFERPGGGSLGDVNGSMTEQQLLTEVLPTLFDCIESLAARQITHRAIRPNKIFYQDADRTRLVLGECVSVPAGADQPRFFETIERAMADPDGRGEGTADCDLYALGVTIANLIIGIDPAAIGDDITARTTHGSYAVLVGRARLLPQVESLLRGLLADDAAGRWGIEEIERWRTGASETPRQRGIGRRAPHGYSFRGAEWRMPRLLAHELAQHRREAMIALREPALELWVRHGLGDAMMAEEVRIATSTFLEGVGDGSAEDLLITRVCRALDPSAPLRFRDMATMEDGLGTILAQAMAAGDRQRMKTLSDLLAGPLLVEANNAENDKTALAKPFALSLQSWARDTLLGAGLERCLYELSPQMSCISPILQGEGGSVAEIMRALDRALEGDDPPRNLFDRHVAAYLASRSRMLERRVLEISRSERDPVRKVVSVLTLLGELQAQSKSGTLRGLTAWAASQLVPCIKTLRRSSARLKLLDDLPTLAAKGDLHKMLGGLDIQKTMQEDRQGFREAVAEYRRLGKAIETIGNAGPMRAWTASEQGQWVSALIAIACLGISLGSVVLQVL